MINSIKVNCVTTKKKQYFIHGIKIYVYFSFKNCEEFKPMKSTNYMTLKLQFFRCEAGL